MSKTSYDNAFAELNQIVEDLQSDQISIDQLAKKAKRANELLSFCRDRLRKIEEDVQGENKEEE